jgi:diguanylate cyclase (GGDEF)-like protein
MMLSIPSIYFWVIKPFVIEHDAAIEKVNYLALTDPLTQLANRRLITTHLKKIISSIVRHHDHGAVMILDLDGFKLVNDAYGHKAGDAVLIEISKRLQSAVRIEDVVGRLGGDEFIVLIDGLGSDELFAHEKMLRIAGNILNIINNPIVYHDDVLHVSASIGICFVGFERMDPDKIILNADAAMYLAKKEGKGCIVFHSN